MTELTPAEQAVLQNYRTQTRRKHAKWIKELEEAGYVVTAPAKEDASALESRPALTRHQRLLYDALRATYDDCTPVSASDLIRRVAQRTGETIPRGSAGTALEYLGRKGYTYRAGAGYLAF